MCIRDRLQAVKKSPFKTVFVVSEKTGDVLYAITQNEEYLESAKKRRKKPKPPPPPPPGEKFCWDCYRAGGIWWDSVLFICGFEWSNGKTPDLNDPLSYFTPIP